MGGLIDNQQFDGEAKTGETGEQFVIFSTDVYISPTGCQMFSYEGDARRQAEIIARNNRGSHVILTRVIGFVSEPLPELQWSDGVQAGSGIERGGLRGGLQGRQLTPTDSVYAAKSSKQI